MRARTRRGGRPVVEFARVGEPATSFDLLLVIEPWCQTSSDQVRLNLFDSYILATSMPFPHVRNMHAPCTSPSHRRLRCLSCHYCLSRCHFGEMILGKPGKLGNESVDYFPDTAIAARSSRAHQTPKGLGSREKPRNQTRFYYSHHITLRHRQAKAS